MEKLKMERKSEGCVEIYEPMLECYIRVYTDKQEYEKLITSNKGEEYSIEEYFDGCTCPRGVFDGDKLCYIMWLRTSKIEIFMHELYHLVSAIDREYNIGEEACAYLVSYVIRAYNQTFIF